MWLILLIPNKFEVFRAYFLYLAVTLPETLSVTEENESVQVCATLSGVPPGGYDAINIILTTSDGIIVVSIIRE